MGVDQRRHIQARIKLCAALAPHAHLKPTGHGLATDLVAQLGIQRLVVGFGPVREWRCQAHQFELAPAGHLAESRVHIGDAPLQVERAHAGEHRVFHSPAKVGLGHQRLLGLHAPAGVAPGGYQHPGRHGAERAHQPEQAAAHHTEGRAVGLRPQHQSVAHRRDGHFVLVRALAPGQHRDAGVARAQRRAGQQLVVAIEQRDGITCQHFGGRAIAQQAVDGIFPQHHATEFALVAQGHLQLQQRRGVALGCSGLRIHGLLKVACQLKGVCGVARGQHFAGHAQLAAAQRGSGMAGADAFFFIDPGDGLQFGVLADQGFGLAHKTCAIHFLVGQIARDAHQLFLALQQPQAHALLGVFHIALEGFVFAFDLFCPQIPESRHDGRHEQQHGSQRCQCSKTVLPGRREVAPPRTPPVRGGGQGGCRRGLVRDGGGVHRCQV